MKRARIADPEIRSPRDSGSQMAEGLFTSEMGIRSDDSDKHPPVPSRTINLYDLQRRALIVENRLARLPLQRRNAAHLVVPRAPDSTVTATVIEINVGDGTATSAATTITAASAETIVSLEDMGSLTVPAGSDVTSATDSVITDSQSPITTPPPSDSISSSSSGSDSSSLSRSTFSGNGTSTGSSTSESVVTVTSVSTLDLAYFNGTFITTSFSGRSTRTSTDLSQLSISTSTDGPAGIGDSPRSTDSTSTTFLVAGRPFETGSTTTSSGSAASSSSARSDGGVPGLSPEQQTVVGGVVGGVAGLAIVLLVILAFLRWYRRRLKARGELPEQIAQRNLAGMSHHHTLSQRSSGVPLTSALAASLRKFRPISSHTQETNLTASTIPESEKSFQRIAGRKIAPVLSTGGDGFGDNYGAFEKEMGAPGPSMHSRNERSLAGSSFYRDSNGFYGGRGDIPSSPTTATTGTLPRSGQGLSTARDFADETGSYTHPSQVSLPSSHPEGMAALRPSPARTPVTISPAASSIGLPIQHTSAPTMDSDAPPLPNFPTMGVGLTVLMPRDAIGRSLASQDGSRASRGSGRSRFAENM